MAQGFNPKRTEHGMLSRAQLGKAVGNAMTRSVLQRLIRQVLNATGQHVPQPSKRRPVEGQQAWARSASTVCLSDCPDAQHEPEKNAMFWRRLGARAGVNKRQVFLKLVTMRRVFARVATC